MTLETVFFGNTVLAYLQALGLFIGAFIVFGLIQTVLINRLEKLAKKSTTDIDDAAVRIAKSIKPGVYAYIAVFLAYQRLVFPDIVDSVAQALLIILIAYQVVIALHILVDYLIGRWKKGDDPSTQAAYDFLGGIIKVILWVLALLFILSNFGVNITTLIAGLGIGGIAIAFALQQILGDLFSSFAIYFDKPFGVGDTIQVGDFLGTVERVGIKTTRVRSVSGEEVVFANQNLTSERIQNFGRMEERRTVFQFGILYETPIEKVRAVPDMVREVFEKLEHIRLERVHFRAFGDSALTFEVTYFTLSSDYNLSLDIQQNINLGLMDRFAAEGIEFAYPTQTLFVKKT